MKNLIIFAVLIVTGMCLSNVARCQSTAVPKHLIKLNETPAIATTQKPVVEKQEDNGTLQHRTVQPSSSKRNKSNHGAMRLSTHVMLAEPSTNDLK